jgi:hypothetical protein
MLAATATTVRGPMAAAPARNVRRSTVRVPTDARLTSERAHEREQSRCLAGARLRRGRSATSSPSPDSRQGKSRRRSLVSPHGGQPYGARLDRTRSNDCPLTVARDHCGIGSRCLPASAAERHCKSAGPHAVRMQSHNDPIALGQKRHCNALAAARGSRGAHDSFVSLNAPILNPLSTLDTIAIVKCVYSLG